MVKGRLENTAVQYISGNYFTVLGVHAFRGRTIQPDDDLPSATPVVMVSQPFWEKSLSGSPDVIGMPIMVNRAPFTIIGVWPVSFIDAQGVQQWGPSGPYRTDIMIPMSHADPSLIFTNGFVLIAFFSIPLILSSTNIATFLLSRAEDRRVEIALRLSLGAGRARLIRQLLTESVLLAVIGGAVGLLVAFWWTRLFANPPFSAYPNLTVNWKALGFVLLAALPIGIACGLLPATAAAGNAARMMQSFGVHFSRSKSARPRHLMAVQVALSFVGLVGIGMMLRTMQNLRSDEIGFSVDNIAVFTIDPRAAAERHDEARAEALYQRVVHALSAIPGVLSVSMSDQPILSSDLRSGRTPVAGIYVWGADRRLQTVDAIWLGVDPAFFKTMGVSLKLGRGFAASDSPAPQKVVINQAFARKIFPNTNPVGNRFGRDLNKMDAYEIVGVAADEKSAAPAQEAAPKVYAQYACCNTNPKSFEVRTAGDPVAMLPAMRAALFDLDPNLPLTKLTTPAAGKRLERKECSEFFGLGALEALTSAKYRVVSFGAPRFRGNRLAVAGAATIRETKMVLINLDGPFVNPRLNVGGNFHYFTSILPPGERNVMLPDSDFRALLLLHEVGHLLGKFGRDTENSSDSQRYNKSILTHCF